jgi:hypothetical protein
VHLGEYHSGIPTENDAMIPKGRVGGQQRENRCTATHRGVVMKRTKNKAKQFSHSLNTATCGLSRYWNMEGCSNPKQ